MQYYSLNYTQVQKLEDAIDEIESSIAQLFGPKAIQYVDLHDGKIRVIIQTSETIGTLDLNQYHLTSPEKLMDQELIASIEKIGSNITEPMMIFKTHPIAYLILKGLAEQGELGNLKSEDIQLFDP